MPCLLEPALRLSCGLEQFARLAAGFAEARFERYRQRRPRRL
jgi:hypothetical protein